MRRRSISFLSSFAVFVALVAIPGRAEADILFIGAWSGGTMARAADNTVVSDLTAASSIQTSQAGATASNTTASATVNGLITTGNVYTSQKTTAVPGGIEVTSKSTVSSVSLLGGLIKIAGVDSTNTSRAVNGVYSYSTSTVLTAIGIQGATLPASIPKNYIVTIPNVATVVLNAQWAFIDQTKGVVVNAAGVYLSLLKPYNNYNAGVQVWLTPTHTQMINIPGVTNATLGGIAFGTEVAASVQNVASIISGPTAQLSMPLGGTNGETISNTTAGVNIPNVATLGAVKTTATGTVNDTLADSKMTAETAQVNLLGGLIKADVIRAEARVSKPSGGSLTRTASNTFLNLVVAGTPIAANPAPNTKITIANIGVVTINAQSFGPNVAASIGLSVVLSTAAYGLPAGAVIYVSAARASVNPV